LVEAVQAPPQFFIKHKIKTEFYRLKQNILNLIGNFKNFTLFFLVEIQRLIPYEEK
jgi:hypothetical protein